MNAHDLPLPAVAVLMAVYVPHAIALSVVDLREHRLPNPLVLSLTLAVALVAAGSALLVPAARGQVAAAVVLAVVGAALAVGVALLAPPLLGMGDAKTLPAALLTTALLGWDALLGGLLGTAVLGGLGGIVALVRTRDVRASFAYGPALLAMPVAGMVLAPGVRTALGV